MKKRLQVLMLAAIPILGAFALYQIRQYQLPENIFRRNAQGVTAVQIDTNTPPGLDPAQHGVQLDANDSARFIAKFHLENHGNFTVRVQNYSWVGLLHGDRESASLLYVSDYGFASSNGWWRGGYDLTPSSKRELNAILKKYRRQFP